MSCQPRTHQALDQLAGFPLAIPSETGVVKHGLLETSAFLDEVAVKLQENIGGFHSHVDNGGWSLLGG